MGFQKKGWKEWLIFYILMNTMSTLLLNPSSDYYEYYCQLMLNT